MGRIVALALAIALPVTSILADEFKIQNKRPSRLLAQMVKGNTETDGTLEEVKTSNVMGMLPAGVVLKADDERGLITAEGSKDQIEKVAFLIKIFDIKPVAIKAQIDLNVPLEKYKSNTETTIQNQSIWKLSDQAAHLNLTFKPRVNSDGTITVNVFVGNAGNGYEITIRAKQNQLIEIPLDNPEPRERPVRKAGEPDPNMPTLKLRLTVQSDPS